jgi:hypothetical protein
LEAWRDLVNPSTRRTLTNLSDKLPVFSGITKQFQMQFHGAYLAGLCEAQLPLVMLWFPKCEELHERVIRRHGDSEYQLPSWACSSFAEEIRVLGLDEVTYIEAE